MTRTYRLAVVAVLMAASGLTACANRQKGFAAQAPDEFLVVSRSPLVVPPDYGLRPPSPGEPRPDELNPEQAARAALSGATRTNLASISPGERAFLTAAHATETDPKVKELIDDEQGDLAHKSEGFANTVMFWRKDQPRQPAAAPGANQSTPIDPEAESRRLATLTGGQPITIQKEPAAEQQKNRRFKLPGL